MVVNHHMHAGNWTQDHWKSSQGHLSYTYWALLKRKDYCEAFWVQYLFALFCYKISHIVTMYHAIHLVMSQYPHTIAVSLLFTIPVATKPTFLGWSYLLPLDLYLSLRLRTHRLFTILWAASNAHWIHDWTSSSILHDFNKLEHPGLRFTSHF